MYPGFKANTSTNRTLASQMTQTPLQTLQREVDNYTRKLQQERRKHTSTEQLLKRAQQQYTKQKAKLDKLKKQVSKSSTMQARVKNLQSGVQKAVSAYDATLAHNNTLKAQIDKLRREKRNFKDIQDKLHQQIKACEQEIQEKKEAISGKKNKSEWLKIEIARIKEKNQTEKQKYISQFNGLEKQYISQRRQRQANKQQKVYKQQPIDTQPLLKYRLKRLTASNKEKFQTIQEYRTHMMQIEAAFEQIKGKFNFNSLEEVTNAFLKSQQQNHSLYAYLDQLNCEVDDLQEQNCALESKINEKNKQLQEREALHQATTEEQRSKIQKNNLIQKKQESEKELKQILVGIEPVLNRALKKLSLSELSKGIHEDVVLHQRNIHEELSLLEEYISDLLICKKNAAMKITTKIKDNITVYSKPLPQVEDLGKQKVQSKEESGKFIQEEKFREYAAQYWEKRRTKNKQN